MAEKNTEVQTEIRQAHQPAGAGEIVLYQPDESIRLEVKLEQDTVWLSQAQLCQLFGKVKSTISYHIGNIFSEGELDRKVAVRKIRTTTPHGAIKDKTQDDELMLYNLDVIISVGYRVHSPQGTRFRIWATKVLKEYLLRGYSINPTLSQVEYHLTRQIEDQGEKLSQLQQQVEKHEKQLDFFIKTSTPPAEMVFFNGQFFTARVAIENLIKTARMRAIIIDHYIDARTFDMFDVRQEGVQGIIYTQGVGPGITRLRDDHNRQTAVQRVEVLKWRVEPHDRWLIIDDHLYHCGHSLNATGSKLSAITLMGTSPEVILAEMK